MNIHLAQSIQARNELKMIANVKYQIIGSKNSNPIIGCEQDALSGAYLLSRTDKKYLGSEVSNFLNFVNNQERYNIKKDKLYTGKEIFSYIIPEGINCIKYDDDKNKIFEILNGELLTGNLDKKSLSTEKNSIIHFIWDKYGPNKTRKFIDETQRLILQYLLYHGFTFSFKDILINNEQFKNIKKLIHDKILEYNVILTQYENDTEQLKSSLIEIKLSEELNSFNDNLGPIIKKFLKSDNNFLTCINSGSKGKITNLNQFIGCVGQKSVEGVRIKKKIENRSMCIFHRDDDTPEARGFVKSSYIDGLKSYEYFYDAIGAREGLIDTAIKSVTWETPIVIIENGDSKYIEIGKWIDELLLINPQQIQHSEERQMELLDIKNTFIPTTDYYGNVTWGSIAAITRHDPGTELYEIKTNSGRSVTVTESKSLLIWNANTNQFKEMLTPDIKIGDCVPITLKLPEPPVIITQITLLDLEVFELNRENGILVGLYASENNIMNESIKNRLGKYKISSNLSRFLKKCTGEYKYIHSEAFVGPQSYIIGLLTGYFSIDGDITNNSIRTISTSKRFLEDISMLCSRIGIFCKVNNNSLEISVQWARVFLENINLFEKNKNNAIEKMLFNHYKRIITFNNVVLDEIVEINLIDISKHPKVYDLTIPSTFNFGLANGLQVRDTAKTGYIQRKLIKGLEDLSIKYDLTNRNSNNIIIQYLYGECGINPSFQTELTIDLIIMNNEDIKNKFGLSKDEISKINKKLKTKDLEKMNTQYINRIKKYRDDLRIIQQIAGNNTKIVEEKFMLPINLIRLTQDYTKVKKTNNIELHPQDIVDSINDLLNDPNLVIMRGLSNDNASVKYLLEIALHNYLCPKKCIFEYELSKKDMVNLMEEIKLNYIKALVDPGEMVGIVAAQSIGEPVSQMSTSFNSQTKIIIKNKLSNNVNFVSTQIGPFCDNLIKKYPELTHGTGHVDSVETDLDTLEDEYYIVGVDAKEKTHWNKISHISRHPVNGNMMKVTTRSGRIVHTTTSHSHLIRSNQTIVPIVGADMTVGMRIPVAKHIDNTFVKDDIEIGEENYKLDYLFGWFVGAYLAEGNLTGNSIRITNISEHFINNTKLFAQRFNKECKINDKPGEYGPGITTYFNCKILAKLLLSTCDTGSFVKRVPDFAFTAPNEFKAGLIQAYIDGDGNFQADATRNQIRVCSRSEQLIKDIALLLSYFDMFASIKCNMVKGSNIYNLAMSARYATLYKKHIGSLLHSDKLDEIIKYDSRDATNLGDVIDKINGLGEIVAKCGKELNLPGQSRNYGRWQKKEAIGRRTLEKYIEIFEDHEDSGKIKKELSVLKQAANSHVIWDEVTDIEIYNIGENDYVYDFTVPANQTFMTDYGIIVHNTLNTKHASGASSKNVSANLGVPHIEELIHYSKDIKTPQMTVYFDDSLNTDKSKVNKIGSYLKYLSIGELIESAEIYYDMNGNDDNSKLLRSDNVSTPFYIQNQKVDINTLPFVIRLKLDIEKMYDKETSLLDIKTKFISYWHKNYINVKTMKKNEKDIFSRISRCVILNNYSNEEQILHIRFQMVNFNYNTITDFLKIVLEDITLKGIENITNTEMNKELRSIFTETGDIVEGSEYVIITNGINIEKLKYFKGINFSRTTCNDIETTYKLYGIEAARQTILNEFNTIFEAGGSKINHTHISVLIDMMTHTGIIISIDRHGLSKVDSEPFAKASFEKQMDHFVNASIFNEKDRLQSVSSRVLMGKVIKGGTGAFQLLLNTNKLENSEYLKDESIGRQTFANLEGEELFKDVIKHGFAKNDFYIPR
jgi:DNA-directed RNA polymerase beta' subunit